MSDTRFTHIGGPTALIEFGAWRILTDPTFDSPGQRYFFGWGTASRKLAGPAIDASDLGRIDVVLVSHHQHGDNLDPSARALLPTWGTTFTTRKAAVTLGGACVGLAAWETATLEAQGKETITITATPGRHGPVGSEPFTGPVVGFSLAWAGQEHGELWGHRGHGAVPGPARGRLQAAGRHHVAAPRLCAVPVLVGLDPLHDGRL